MDGVAGGILLGFRPQHFGVADDEIA